MSGFCPDCGHTQCVCDEIEFDEPLGQPMTHEQLAAAFRNRVIRRRDKFSYENIRALRRKVKHLIEQVAIRDISIGRWRTEARFWKSEAQRQMRARRQAFDQLRWENRCMSESYRRLRVEYNALKQQQWEPAEGVWLVAHNSYGRSSTLVANPDVAEREAVLRAVLEMDYDVAVRAIQDTYERNKFCPTMLAHEDHDGFCGIWPSAMTIWERIRNALASQIGENEYS